MTATGNYTIIQNEIWSIKSLNSYDRDVLFFIVKFKNAPEIKMACSFIAKELKISTSTVKKALKKLQKLNIITKKSNEGFKASNSYIINPVADWIETIEEETQSEDEDQEVHLKPTTRTFQEVRKEIHVQKQSETGSPLNSEKKDIPINDQLQKNIVELISQRITEEKIDIENPLVIDGKPKFDDTKKWKEDFLKLSSKEQENLLLSINSENFMRLFLIFSCNKKEIRDLAEKYTTFKEKFQKDLNTFHCYSDEEVTEPTAFDETRDIILEKNTDEETISKQYKHNFEMILN